MTIDPDGPDEGPEFTDLSANANEFGPYPGISDLERSLALRAINTERNMLVSKYAIAIDYHGDIRANGRVSGYSDQPWEFAGTNVTFTEQIIALNCFEARLIGCECCFNNADDSEHYHSDICDPLYQEGNVPSPDLLRSAAYGLKIGDTRTLFIQILDGYVQPFCEVSRW